MLKRHPFALVASFLFLCSPAMAQSNAGDPPPQPSPVPSTVESRADQPPESSAQATDQPPPIVTKIRNYIRTSPIIAKLKGDGFYPRIGGLSQGSGLAGGGGYRRHLNWAFVDVSGAISTKAYRGLDATLGWLQTRHFDASSKLTFRNNTQDDFYGLGMDSGDATRVDYGIRTFDVSTRAAFHLGQRVRVGADIGYYVPDVRHGRDQNLRTIEAIFTDATAPGLSEQPHFLHDSVFAEMDTRDAHGFPRHGGFYRTAYALWDDRTLEQYNFRRLDIVGSHFFSVASQSVVALQLGLTYTNNAPGDRVPFYLLPYVGGHDTIRSFREFRFRDENAGVFNVEFRQKVHSMVHVAGFVDFGKVAHDWQDINPTDTMKAYGIGLRGGTDEKTYVRFDIATGDGGTRIFFKFTPSF